MIAIVIILLSCLQIQFTHSFTRNFLRLRTQQHSYLSAQTWQEDVDTLLNIDTECDNRRELALGLIGKASEIRDDVIKSIEDRDIKKLAPSNLKYGKAVAGLQAFQRQLVNDIIPDLFTKSIPKAIEIGPKAINDIIKTAPEKVDELITTARDLSSDPSMMQSTVDEFRKEVRNIFLSTPEGLQTPVYTVEKVTDSYEIRKYATYSVVSTQLKSSDETSVRDADHEMLDPINSGNGFNTLATYLFGKNIRKEKMSMTTPVIIESGVMEFVLPDGLTTQTAPTPETEDVVIRDVPVETVAVREFPGTVLLYNTIIYSYM